MIEDYKRLMKKAAREVCIACLNTNHSVDFVLQCCLVTTVLQAIMEVLWGAIPTPRISPIGPVTVFSPELGPIAVFPPELACDINVKITSVCDKGTGEHIRFFWVSSRKGDKVEVHYLEYPLQGLQPNDTLRMSYVPSAGMITVASNAAQDVECADVGMVDYPPRCACLAVEVTFPTHARECSDDAACEVCSCSRIGFVCSVCNLTHLTLAVVLWSL